jgi:hypothetical protein
LSAASRASSESNAVEGGEHFAGCHRLKLGEGLQSGQVGILERLLSQPLGGGIVKCPSKPNKVWQIVPASPNLGFEELLVRDCPGQDQGNVIGAGALLGC